MLNTSLTFKDPVGHTENGLAASISWAQARWSAVHMPAQYQLMAPISRPSQQGMFANVPYLMCGPVPANLVTLDFKGMRQ